MQDGAEDPLKNANIFRSVDFDWQLPSLMEFHYKLDQFGTGCGMWAGMGNIERVRVHCWEQFACVAQIKSGPGRQSYKNL